MPYAKEVERNKARLAATFKIWLASGVTSVVDIAGRSGISRCADAALKSPAAPRVAVAGPLLSMIDRVKLDLGDPPIIKIASADEARALVRASWSASPISSRSGSSTGWATISPRRRRSSKLLPMRPTRPEYALPCTRPSSSWPSASLRAGAEFSGPLGGGRGGGRGIPRPGERNRALYCPTLFVTLGYSIRAVEYLAADEAERRLADPQIVAAMNDLQKIPRRCFPNGWPKP